MNIKQKLYSLGIIATVGVLSLVTTNLYFDTTARELTQAQTLVNELETRLLQLRRIEKDFLLRMDANFLGEFDKNITMFLETELSLSNILTKYELPSSVELKRDVQSYKISFENLVSGFEQYGFNDNSGLKLDYYREFDLLIRNLEQYEVLSLYMFDQNLNKGQLNLTNIASLSNSSFVDAARRLHNQHTKVGLNYNEGLLGDTRQKAHAVEEHFEDFSTKLSEQVDILTSRTTQTSTVVSIIVLLVIICLIFQISRSINRQVSFLLKVIQEIATTKNVSMRAHLKGNDEITDIGRYFDSLLEELESLIAGTKEKSNILSSSTHSMHTKLENVIREFDVQAEHTGTMAIAVQEMVSTISEISESTSIAVEGVHKAASNANSGRNVVQSTVGNIDELSAILRESQQSITSLNDHVAKIDGAVHIIQEIAEQTNLLALNAAIEAARAGEQGRGFAVVADEVRALASRTHKSTEDITNVVSSIQNQMSAVVVNIERCNEQGQQTRDASHELDKSLSQIISDMNDIQANSERIASAIEEQGLVMNQVSGSIVKLNSISDNNMQSAQECLAEVDSVSQQSNKMDEAVAAFITS
ncbi:methyl-accepting chemotaxis protein [Vibrio sp.]|uniref:methyl-accepting chemotaxis protein n=1 Tax=Vibrio sp. TaxID=678 RepID=UPI00379CEC7A